jgi:hypothetical protein
MQKILFYIKMIEFFKPLYQSVDPIDEHNRLLLDIGKHVAAFIITEFLLTNMKYQECQMFQCKSL